MSLRVECQSSDESTRTSHRPWLARPLITAEKISYSYCQYFISGARKFRSNPDEPEFMFYLSIDCDRSPLLTDPFSPNSISRTLLMAVVSPALCWMQDVICTCSLFHVSSWLLGCVLRTWTWSSGLTDSNYTLLFLLHCSATWTAVLASPWPQAPCWAQDCSTLAVHLCRV